MFVKLNRRFLNVPMSVESAEQSEAGLRTIVSGRIGWEALLKEHRAVILSEAGAGKTQEIRETARELRKQGKRAFFLRLEHVARDFDVAFEEGSIHEFNEWVSGTDEGWVFLDSVDEARLKSPLDFELAIRRVGSRLSPALQRTHIVLTSRPHAWRYKTDLLLCQSYLPYEPPAKNLVADEDLSAREGTLDEDALEWESTERDLDDYGSSADGAGPADGDGFRILMLDDLDRDQVSRLAEALGVPDVSQFLNAIERADAWSFTARPQDAIELIEYWIDNGRIGTRFDLFSASAERRLRERDVGRAQLESITLDRARDGAIRLAAALVLARQPSIEVPDVDGGNPGLAAAQVLPSWPQPEILSLLARPLFDEAIYGTVRIHHRSVREFLAASWFAKLLKSDSSRSRVERLFFKTQYGVDVIAPSLRPLLPWLAILDDQIRAKLRKLAPEVFFEGGDPSRLDLPTRRNILESVCAEIADPASNATSLDLDAVQRFSAPDLTADVSALLTKYRNSPSVVRFLLRMCWQGEYKELAQQVAQIVVDNEVDDTTRRTAIRALGATGTVADIAEARRALSTRRPQMPRDVLAQLISVSEPDSALVDWVVDRVGAVEEKIEHGIDELSAALVSLANRLPEALLPIFINHLASLLEREPFVDEAHCRVSAKNAWITPAAARAVERAASAHAPVALAPTALRIVRLHATLKRFDSVELIGDRTKLSEVVLGWAELNRGLFWEQVAADRAERFGIEGARLTDIWQVRLFDSYVRIRPEDFDRFVADIRERSLEDDRLLALSVAHHIYAGNPVPERLEELRRVTSGDPLLSRRLDELLAPRVETEEAREMRRREEHWKRREAQRRAAEASRLEEPKNYATSHLDEITDLDRPGPGRLPTPLANILQAVQVSLRKGHDWSDDHWRTLDSMFGPSVSAAVREAVIGVWKRYSPPLVSEGAAHNTTNLGTRIGAIGLSVEARREGWVAHLNDADVQRAFRYAMRELNGFPSWMRALFDSHRDTVLALVVREIEHELATETAAEGSHYLLYDVSWSGSWIWDHVAPYLRDRVRDYEPRNVQNLQYILSVLQSSSITDRELAELARQKVADAAVSSDNLAHWFAVWVGTSPADALPALRARLVTMGSADERTRFMMVLLVQLIGGRTRKGARSRESFRTPDHLRDLFEVASEHVRRSDDVNRRGGVYSPGLRDDAQAARDQLLTLLADIPGGESYLAILKLAESQTDPELSAWLRTRAFQKATADSDGDAWSPGQIAEFGEALERTPKNPLELFELVCLRLEDLKVSLESGDTSMAAILLLVKDEETLRNYFGDQFRTTARGRYSVPQEEELADAKRPDIRVHGSGFDAAVPIELKIADSWSGNQLFERLEEQLCGDYLRDPRSARGVFLLVHRGDKPRWDLPSGQRVDFGGLVDALQTHWIRLAPHYPHIQDVRVFGIDLTERSK